MTKKADFMVITTNAGITDNREITVNEETSLTEIYNIENKVCFAVIGLNGKKASDYLRM